MMLLFTTIGANYSIDDLPHMGELEKWLFDVAKKGKP
jgi:hypothetical protein